MDKAETRKAEASVYGLLSPVRFVSAAWFALMAVGALRAAEPPAALPPFAVARLGRLGADAPLTGIYGIAFAPDGRQLATRGADQIVRVWDVAASKQLTAIDGHRDRVQALAYSLDGKVLATCSEGEDPAVRFWDPATGKMARQAAIGANLLQYLPPGQTLLGVSRTNATMLNIAGDAISVKQLPGGAPVAISGDGTLIAFVDSVQGLRLCSATTGVPGPNLRALGAPPISAAFSPDNSYLAGGTLRENSVQLWDLRRGVLHIVLAGHMGPVQAVAFSPDSRHLATASWDKTVRIWELATRRPVAVLEGHQDHVCAVAFSSDGRQLASGAAGADDTTALIWDARKVLYPARQDVSKLDPAGQDILLRNLSADDPATAYPAIGSLLSSPATAQRLLASGLGEKGKKSGEEAIRLLLKQLDDDDFTIREAAHKQLFELRPGADALLRATLTTTPSAEVRHRIEQILEKPLGAKTPVSDADRRWLSRAVLTLELIADADAIKLLSGIAQQPGGEPHVAEAVGALKRLGAAK